MDRCCCRQCTAKPAAAQLGVTLSKNKLTQLYENTEEQLVNWLTPLLHNKVPPHRRECWGTVCINLASSQCWPVLTLCDNQSVCVSIICFAGELLQINWLCVFDYTALNHRTLLSVYVWTAVAVVTHHTHCRWCVHNWWDRSILAPAGDTRSHQTMPKRTSCWSRSPPAPAPLSATAAKAALPPPHLHHISC